MNNFIKSLGYTNLTELFNDSLHYVFIHKIMAISFIFGMIASLIEDLVGLKPVVLLVFCLLILLEFVVSVKVKSYGDQKIKNVFWTQVIVKWFIYALIVGIMNTLSKYLGQVDIWGFSMNIYQWLYYSTINIIILQLFVSLFEKLSKLGFAESSKLFKVIKKKLDNWLELDDEDETITQQTQETIFPDAQRENTFRN